MRALSNTFTAILDSPARFANTLVRVYVRDSGGTLRDLTTYPEDNFVVGVTVRDDIDSNGPTATVTLRKAIELKSLAPLMDDSPLNKGFNVAASPVSLLELGRIIVIECATLPEGKPVQSGDWFQFFYGYIDSIDLGDDVITIAARDQAKQLQDCWIETERAYAFCQGAYATAGAKVFQTGKAYSINELVTPSNGKPNAHFYRVTTAGTSGTSEPTWPTGGASTVTSGTAIFTESGATSASTATAVETVMQQIITDNLGAITLYTPVSPGWNIRAFTQQRQSTWDAVRALASQIGWDLRFKWRSATNQFELTFYEPDRAKTTPDRTFGPDDEWRISKIATSIFDIRNVIRIVWTDPTVVDSAGVGTRTEQNYGASTSIATYGRRFMEIQEAQTSNIDSGTEASDFANALLSDLAMPKMDRVGTFECFPICELGDLYRFSADDINYSSDQDLAVVAYEHTISADEATTTISARGTPAGGHQRWIATLAAWEEDEIHRLNPLLVTQTSLTATNAIGGKAIAVGAAEMKGNLPALWEYHTSPTTGFVPDSSTLKNISQSRRVVLTDHTPGDTYFAKAIPIYYNDSRIIRGLPTEEISFVAYQADAAQLSDEVQWGRVPLNGGFESSVDGGDSADHWTEYGGSAWTTELILKNDTEAKTGSTYLQMVARSAGTSKVKSAYFNLDSSSVWGFSGWIRVDGIGVGAAGTLNVYVEYFDTTKSSVGTETLKTKTCSGSTGWLRFDTTNNPDALGYTDATYARIKLELSGPGTSGNTTVSVDSVAAVNLGERWIDVDGATMPNGDTAPSFTNSWVNYGGSTAVTSFRKDPSGMIELKGVIKSGTVGTGTPAFTLPTGYRPAEERTIAIDSNGAHGNVIVKTTGAVAVQVGSNVWACLDGITFSTW